MRKTHASLTISQASTITRCAAKTSGLLLAGSLREHRGGGRTPRGDAAQARSATLNVWHARGALTTFNTQLLLRSRSVLHEPHAPKACTACGHG